MKNIQWVLNVIFAIILSYFIIDEFENEKPIEGAIVDELVKPVSDSSVTDLNIRYINSDSIYKKFKMVDDLRMDLEERQKQFSYSLESKVKKFEEEVTAFQQAASSMSQFEGQQKQKELLAKEQELGQMQQELSNKLLEMENAMQIKIRNKVLDYLELYKGKGIDLVLDFSNNSSLLMAQDEFDITGEVVDSLNSAYQSQKNIK